MIGRLCQWVRDWVLPLGVLVFCCGLFVATGRTAYKTMVYLAVLAPALGLVVLSPKTSFQAVFGNPVRVALAVFVIWAASSASWATQQSESDSFLKYAIFILLFALAFSRELGPDDRRLMAMFRVSAGLAAVYAIYSVVRWYGIEGHAWEERFSGLPPLFNPLVTGYFMGFFIALVMSDFVAFRFRRWTMWTAIPATAALVVMVLATQSRTPLLALVMTAIVLALVQRGLRGWVVAGLTLTAAALLFAFNESLWERGLSWRPWIWHYVWEHIPGKWWLGHGLGDELLIVIPANGWEFYEPHNMHLSVLYYTGLVGLALWVILLVMAVRGLWFQRRQPEALLGLGLLTYGMVACSFDGGYLIARPRENWFTLWLPLVLAARWMMPPLPAGTVNR